jgi:hypothetical protein
MIHTLLVTLLLLPLSFGIGNQGSGSGGISGRVIDAKEGVPIPMVQVRTNPVSGVAVTDSDGKYSIRGLRYARYIVIASKPGYLENRVSINVSSDNTTADILLTPKPSRTPPAHGLVAHYPFDGSIQDRSGGNSNGIPSYDVQWVSDRFGKPDGALHFDGATGYVRLGNVLNSVFSASVAKFTVAGWAKTDMYPSHQGGGSIVAKAAGGAAGPYQWSVTHDHDGRLKGFVPSKLDASAYLEKQSEVISVGRWLHFALVFDGSLTETDRVQLYVDGIAGVTSRHVGIFGVTTQKSDQEITVGATHHAGLPFSADNFYLGTIDDIRIYNRALSQAEIQGLLRTEKRE